MVLLLGCVSFPSMKLPEDRPSDKTDPTPRAEEQTDIPALRTPDQPPVLKPAAEPAPTLWGRVSGWFKGLFGG